MQIIKIDKNCLLDLLKDGCEDIEEYCGCSYPFLNIISILDSFPIENVEVHAKWVDRYRSGWKPDAQVAICSHCNQLSYKFDDDDHLVPITSDKCPNCGACMDG